MVCASAGEMPFTSAISSGDAWRNASIERKCVSNARLRAVPTDGMLSSREAMLFFKGKKYMEMMDKKPQTGENS